MTKSHRRTFSRTDAGLCIYHLFIWSNFNFLHNSQWITMPTQSCLVLYSFWTNLQHLLIIIIIIIIIIREFNILNKSRRQHPTRHQLYGHLPPITKTIQVRQTRHTEHCLWCRDELISDVLLWTPTYGRTKAGRPARTYIQQLCEDTGCSLEDLPEAMNDRDKWRERDKDIRASGPTWWWWWWWESSSQQCKLMVFHWSPNDCKSPEVSKTLLYILAGFKCWGLDIININILSYLMLSSYVSVCHIYSSDLKRLQSTDTPVFSAPKYD